jgi:hypothetical protein
MIHTIYKIISVFFLWLAWLVITAHMIIPHDHHLSDSFTHQGDSSPRSDSKTNHFPCFPVHCHAFNDLCSEKATTFILNKNFQSVDISFCSFCDFVPDLQVRSIVFKDECESFPDLPILKLYLLRAPPSLS